MKNSETKDKNDWPYKPKTILRPPPPVDSWRNIPRLSKVKCTDKCDEHWQGVIAYRALSNKAYCTLQNFNKLKVQLDKLKHHSPKTKISSVVMDDYKVKDNTCDEYHQIFKKSSRREIDCLTKKTLKDPTWFHAEPYIPHEGRPPASLFIGEGYSPWPGLSEYQDTFSRDGMRTFKNYQQYKYPYPIYKRSVPGQACRCPKGKSQCCS